MALVHDVVVIRDRLTWFDGAIFRGGGVRREAAGEPRRVEPELEMVTGSLERLDVTVDPVAARLHGNPFHRGRAESERRESCRGDERNGGQDDQNDELWFDDAAGKHW